jgi:protease-4
MNNQRSGCLTAALIVSILLLVVSIVLNLILMVGSTPSMGGSLASTQGPKFEEGTLVPSKDKDGDKIAVIYLRGLISGMEPGSIGETMVEDIKLQFKQAADDAKVKAVVLHVDSPGGEVTASDTIYNIVRKFRDEKKKPVVIYMGSLAASGGYYVSCGGSWVVANETTFTGSIGVIMSTINYRVLAEKVGVEFVTIKSGKMKDMMSGSRAMTDEERQYLQDMVMQTYGKFVGIVARERGLPEDELRNGIADGRVISGKDALGAKLVDQLGDVDDAYAKAMELGKAKNASIIRYESSFKLGRLLRLLGESNTKGSKAKVEVDLGASFGPKLDVGRLYYLPPFFAQ